MYRLRREGAIRNYTYASLAYPRAIMTNSYDVVLKSYFTAMLIRSAYQSKNRAAFGDVKPSVSGTRVTYVLRLKNLYLLDTYFVEGRRLVAAQTLRPT